MGDAYQGKEVREIPHTLREASEALSVRRCSVPLSAKRLSIIMCTPQNGSSRNMTGGDRTGRSRAGSKGRNNALPNLSPRGGGARCGPSYRKPYASTRSMAEYRAERCRKLSPPSRAEGWGGEFM